MVEVTRPGSLEGSALLAAWAFVFVSECDDGTKEGGITRSCGGGGEGV